MSSNQCRLLGINYDPYRGYPSCIVPSESQRCALLFSQILQGTQGTKNSAVNLPYDKLVCNEHKICQVMTEFPA